MIILANEVGRNKQIKGEKIMTIFQEKELLWLVNIISQDDPMELPPLLNFLGTALICYNMWYLNHVMQNWAENNDYA